MLSNILNVLVLHHKDTDYALLIYNRDIFYDEYTKIISMFHELALWPSVQEQFRAALMTAQILLIKGTVESRDGVTHVIASALYDHSHALSDLAVKPRDFH